MQIFGQTSDKLGSPRSSNFV